MAIIKGECSNEALNFALTTVGIEYLKIIPKGTDIIVQFGTHLTWQELLPLQRQHRITVEQARIPNLMAGDQTRNIDSELLNGGMVEESLNHGGTLQLRVEKRANLDEGYNVIIDLIP